MRAGTPGGDWTGAGQQTFYTKTSWQTLKAVLLGQTTAQPYIQGETTQKQMTGVAAHQ